MIKLLYHKLLVIIALCGFIFYVCWNVFYISQGFIPASILYKLTGVPSPTTGMYRSFIGLINMDYETYIIYNPFVIPFILLLLITAVVIVKRIKNRQPVLINNILKNSYLLIFVISEIWLIIRCFV